MTELNDHLKLLFARAAVLHCRGCGEAVRRDTPGSILDALRAAGLDRVMVTFEVKVPEGASPAGLVELLASQGYTRVHRERPDRIEVIQDRFRLGDGGGARAGGSTHFDGRARSGDRARSGEHARCCRAFFDRLRLYAPSTRPPNCCWPREQVKRQVHRSRGCSERFLTA